MKNTFGNAISVTLFGESHGPEIGAVVDGLAPGMKVDLDYIGENYIKEVEKYYIELFGQTNEEIFPQNLEQ